MQIVSTQTAAHYTWGNQCDGWHLVRSGECSVIQERMPPKTSETTHYHSRSRQFFYVLSGTLSILVEGEMRILGAATGLEIAPGVTHRVFNDSDSEVRFLVISAPPSHGDRIAAG